jgi:hypothetical protein
VKKAYQNILLAFIKMSSDRLTLLLGPVMVSAKHLYSVPARTLRRDCNLLEPVTYVRTRIPTLRSNLPQRECPRSADNQPNQTTTSMVIPLIARSANGHGLEAGSSTFHPQNLPRCDMNLLAVTLPSPLIQMSYWTLSWATFQLHELYSYIHFPGSFTVLFAIALAVDSLPKFIPYSSFQRHHNTSPS